VGRSSIYIDWLALVSSEFGRQEVIRNARAGRVHGVCRTRFDMAVQHRGGRSDEPWTSAGRRALAVARKVIGGRQAANGQHMPMVWRHMRQRFAAPAPKLSHSLRTQQRSHQWAGWGMIVAGANDPTPPADQDLVPALPMSVGRTGSPYVIMIMLANTHGVSHR
jgi:hypothetical protein